MKDGRSVPDRVQWHEGMLLAPQHFQQADQRSEALLHYHLQANLPFSWGIRRLRFDPALLAKGILRVTELEAILPDGLLVTDPADEEEELSVDLTSYVEGRPQGALKVHLAVPALRRSHAPSAGTLARLRSVEGDVIEDENTGEGSIQVPRLRPRATLIVGETAPEKYTSFPVAVVEFQEETFSLGTFIPPSFEITPRSPLGDQASRITARLRENAAFLSEKILAASSRGESDTRAGEMQDRLKHLVTPLGLLEALLPQSPHPWPLYLALCQATGQVSSLQPGTIPPNFPRYDHDDLFASFEPVLGFLNRILDGVRQSYRVVPFALDDATFQVFLASEAVIGRGNLLVGVSGGKNLTEPEVDDWMRECRIGASSVMPSLRQRRIRGAQRDPAERDDELGVYPGRGTSLFRIRVDPEFIRAGEPLEIAHPSATAAGEQPAQLVLYLPVGG
jgi:type VI secretion system protein ImpJ